MKKGKQGKKSGDVTAYLGLGSNLGDRKASLLKAIDLLRQTRGIDVLQVSSFYENPAIGLPDQPTFINAAVAIRTHLAPLQLLQAVLQIEQILGRVRVQRWAARTIDIDILLYGEERVDLPSLTIPHPELRHREFVLRPLRELGCTL